jgi:hypothetical protein
VEWNRNKGKPAQPTRRKREAHDLLILPMVINSNFFPAWNNVLSADYRRQAADDSAGTDAQPPPFAL